MRPGGGGMIRVGISGWSYREWRGGFYPKGLPPGEALAYAARRVGTIEINATFYGRQGPERFRRWHAAVPEDFLFAVKGPRQVTHHARLAGSEPVLASFFGSGVLELGEKLGAILWQLPAGLAFEPALVERFLAILPRDTAEAARLAGLAEGAPRRLRHAVEARHASFAAPHCAALLDRRDVALVVADGAGLPCFDQATGSLVYVRLHGTRRRYTGSYDGDALDRWAERIRRWAGSGKDVLVYFNNTMKGEAPFDAIALARRLGLVRDDGIPPSPK